MNYGLSSKLIPEVEEEVWFLCAVTVSEGSSERTKHRLVVVSALNAVERLVVEEFLQLLCLLGHSHTKQHVVVGCYAKLSLKLCGDELIGNILDVSYTSERHLLLQVMTKPVASYIVGKNHRNNVAKKQTSVNHRLKRESPAKGKRLSPTGTNVTHASLTIKFDEIVRHISVASLEASTTSRELPIILAIVIEAGTIADVMFIIEGNIC